MRRFIALTLAVAGAAAGAACGNSPPDPGLPPIAATSQPDRVPGEYLVILATPADAKIIRDVYGSLGIRRISEIASGVFIVTLVQDPGPATMEKLRAKNPGIKAVEPNFEYRIQKNP